ncbi:ferrochelatase [Schaalia sp. 19OD2882]|uniref:ferrochelatase n=1 Tax=Schaalia sp. 19OD2882 TaxID=2794089 RepID=UPI001C1EB15E|nr:ferrochelatase [Schaalia sp. 19OD2882]QWW20568.1 ferrochelatase [Schaalia sp. 19OD2882]
MTGVSETVSDPARRPVVLLVNLGTPEAPTPSAIRPFLREFLSDRRVVEMHPLLWRPILEAFILTMRPGAIAPQYRKIWTEHGSPLMHWTLRQGQRLHEVLGDEVDVRVAMRYGSPSIASVLDQLHADGHRRLLVLPAYPHYSGPTIGSVLDEVARWTLRTRDVVEMRCVRSFEDDPAYIDALARSVEQHWEQAGSPAFAAGERLIISYHSIPVAMHEGGDPYRSQCETTSALLAERLAVPKGGVVITYQSVFGRAEWIGPATIDTVRDLGAAGCSRVDVICPGFMADCLETLEEIDQLNRETFTQAGGGDFHYIQWANDSEGCVQALAAQVRRHTAGWIDLA